MPARSTLGDQASAQPRSSTTSPAPKAAAVRRIAPTLLGSWTPSRNTHGVTDFAPMSGIAISAAIPAGLSASAMARNNPSDRTTGSTSALTTRAALRSRPSAVAKTHSGLSPCSSIAASRCGPSMMARLSFLLRLESRTSFAQRRTRGLSRERSTVTERTCASRRRCRPGIVAPRIAPLHARDRIKARRILPLRLGGQAPARKPAIGFGLVPADVHDRLIGRDWNPAIEAPQRASAPVKRFSSVFRCPALAGPVLALAVAACLHEAEVLCVGHRGARHAKWRQDDRVAPFLVVERELRARARAELEAPSGELGVARDAVAGKSARGRELRRRIAERLARVVEGFGVHVLVPRGEPGKIRQVRPAAVPYTLHHSVQHLVAVLESARERW